MPPKKKPTETDRGVLEAPVGNATMTVTVNGVPFSITLSDADSNALWAAVGAAWVRTLVGVDLAPAAAPVAAQPPQAPRRPLPNPRIDADDEDEVEDLDEAEIDINADVSDQVAQLLGQGGVTNDRYTLQMEEDSRGLTVTVSVGSQPLTRSTLSPTQYMADGSSVAPFVQNLLTEIRRAERNL